MQLPDDFVLPAIALALILLGIFASSNLHAALMQLVYAIVFALVYFCLWFFSKGRWIGDGDIRLAFLIGLLLTGPQLLLAILVSYVSAALIAIVLLIRKQKKGDDRLAFGPFLVFGLYFALFFGPTIISWYSSLLSLNL